MLTLEMVEAYREGRRARSYPRWDYDRGWITLDGNRIAKVSDASTTVELWLRSHQPEIDEAAAELLGILVSEDAAAVLIRWYRDTTNQWVEV